MKAVVIGNKHYGHSIRVGSTVEIVEELDDGNLVCHGIDIDGFNYIEQILHIDDINILEEED